MTAYLARRLGQGVFTLLAMSLIVFAGVYAIGDPVAILIPPQSTQAEAAALAQSLGLDRPLWEQYLRFLRDALSGDLGRSFVAGGPALALILERAPATLELAFAALFAAVLLGVPLGLWAGLRPRSIAGRVIGAGSLLGFSLPTFWVGLVLILAFAVGLGWLPATGRGATRELFGLQWSFLTLDGLAHLAMPAATLALYKLALVVRLTRAGVREALPLDYVRFARAKGLTEARVVGGHVLRNLMIPLVTVLGLELGSLIAFAVVTETLFAWPGTGKLLIDSINGLDRPVVVAYLLAVTALFVAINFAVDVLYALLDPRVRLGAGR